MILIGLHFLHIKMNIAHRDFHTKNIMIDILPGGVEVFKIGDFGLSNFDEKESKINNSLGVRTAPLYRSPETISVKP